VRSCDFQLQFPYDQEPVLLTGDTGRLIPVSQDEAGLTRPETATQWSSSNPSVAQVDATGLVTALQPGTAEISADGCVGFYVEVVARPTTIEILPDTLRLVPGNQGYLEYVPRDAYGAGVGHSLLDSLVRWLSDDARVVVVSPDPPFPSVSAVAEGIATVTATIGDVSGTMAVIVAGVALGAPGAGAVYTCALSTDSLAYCWGNTMWLNLVTSGPGYISGPAPVALPGDLRFVSLASGASHACGLTPDGALYCMGSNEFGQLGVGVDGPVVGQARVLAGTQFASVSAGAAHTCALTSDGRLLCWGLNLAGQLGSSTAGECTFIIVKGPGTTVPCSRVPLEAAPGLTFASVRAGSGLTCGRTTGGEIYCWGLQYGPEPTLVGGGLGLDSIDVGGASYLLTAIDTVTLACGLDAAGAAYCWGKSRDGLGDGSTTESWTPIPVGGGLTFSALSVGLGVCGLADAGAIYCWGGRASGFAQGTTPVRVPGTQTFTTVSVGSSHGCGLATDGRVYCWGSNYESQLGVTGADRSSPVRVLGQR
jgi:alpha-tubulin suppressor-like RCC1 family protein